MFDPITTSKVIEDFQDQDSAENNGQNNKKWIKKYPLFEGLQNRCVLVFRYIE